MVKKILIFILSLFTVDAMATTPFLYQVDIIMFSHKASPVNIQTPVYVVPPLENAKKLGSQTDEEIPYHILSEKHSNLLDEYTKLKEKGDYNILFHLSWLQPVDNEIKIAIDKQNSDWDLKGVLSIKQGTYYTFETDLILSHQNIQFPLNFKKRLRPETVYYLDHQYSGILIKIHQII